MMRRVVAYREDEGGDRLYRRQRRHHPLPGLTNCAFSVARAAQEACTQHPTGGYRIVMGTGQ